MFEYVRPTHGPCVRGVVVRDSEVRTRGWDLVLGQVSTHSRLGTRPAGSTGHPDEVQGHTGASGSHPWSQEVGSYLTQRSILGVRLVQSRRDTDFLPAGNRPVGSLSEVPGVEPRRD